MPSHKSWTQILDICGGSRTSLMEWTQAYRQRGLPALLDHRNGGNRARLKPDQIEAVQTKLHRDTPAALLGRDHCLGDGQFWTVADLARLMERDYGVVYQSHTSYLTLLQLLDASAKVRPELSASCQSYQRPAKQYKSHSEVKVMDFEERLEKK